MAGMHHHVHLAKTILDRWRSHFTRAVALLFNCTLNETYSRELRSRHLDPKCFQRKWPDTGQTKDTYKQSYAAPIRTHSTFSLFSNLPHPRTSYGTQSFRAGCTQCFFILLFLTVLCALVNPQAEHEFATFLCLPGFQGCATSRGPFSYLVFRKSAELVSYWRTISLKKLREGDT